MKAQVSFEYLITWGWALLLILGGISIFYSFDIISFNQYVDNKCDVFGQFSCLESNAGYVPGLALGEMRFRLYNEIGTDIVLYNFTAEGKGFTCTPWTENEDWDRNSEKSINLTNCAGETYFDDARVDASITFYFYKNYTSCRPAPVDGCMFQGRGVIRQTVYEE